jgi:hypothetical protein
MIYLALFANSFAYIFLKAWQQLNVIHHQLFWIVPTSFLMALCEVYTVVHVAHQGVGLVALPLGLGGGLGCLASMLLHKRTRKEKNNG